MNEPSIDELRRWIGRRATYVAPEPLGAAAIRCFALALGDDNPLYHDAEVAARSRHGDIIAPPTLICETNQFYRRPPDADGYTGHVWNLPLPGRRFIRGGNAYSFHQPARPTDRITIDWQIADIFARDGRAGLRLIFVVSEVRYTNQHAALLAVNRETGIYLPGIDRP